jgi:cytochrome c-type biogenesis protein CcsB
MDMVAMELFRKVFLRHGRLARADVASTGETPVPRESDMKFIRYVVVLGVLMLSAVVARAEDRVSVDEFAREVDLDAFKRLTIQHQQTLKTFETFSRQTLTTITGRPRLDGRDPTFTILDMAFRPEDYEQRNIVRIKVIPVREELAEGLRLAGLIDQAEADRIVKYEGTVSLEVMRSATAQKILQDLRASDTRKEDAVRQAMGAANTLAALSVPDLPFFTIIPPASPDEQVWRNLGDVAGNVPAAAAWLQLHGLRVPEPLPGYEAEHLTSIDTALIRMLVAWRQRDAGLVYDQIQVLATVLPQVNPGVYPSAAKRTTEVMYNRLTKFTIPGFLFYFAAFVCLVLASRSGVEGLRLWGLRLLVLAFVIHTIGIGIRWWLAPPGRIPIMNQFESVMTAAWFGALIGIVVELVRRRGRGMIGASAAFVGWFALISLWATPYVAGRDIGGEIGQVAGVLHDRWLYIHVNLVIASYALIAMSFMLGVWWLIRYYMEYRTLRKVPARQLSEDAAPGEDVMPSGSGIGGAGVVALSPWQTLARMLFVPVGGGPVVKDPDRRSATQTSGPAWSEGEEVSSEVRSRRFLATIDQCHVVVLQMAFWLLGVGIVTGAIWADHSWGRPWAWDPKETFALVTWIVYLVVVHVRFITEHKAWWTAALSVVGFFVMLFNWIGVNFFLVGLHSYA